MKRNIKMIVAFKEKISCERLLSQAKPKSITGKIILFPLMRIVIVALFLSPVILTHFLIDKFAISAIPEQYKILATGFDIMISLGLFIFLYRLYTKQIEKRAALEFTFANGIKDLSAGLILGGGLITSLVLMLLTEEFCGSWAALNYQCSFFWNGQFGTFCDRFDPA